MDMKACKSINSSGGRARRRRLVIMAMAAAVLGLTPVASQATTVAISGDTANSTEALGDFDGTLSYSFSSSTVGELTLTLKNTSTTSGGLITGFVLNNPGKKISSITGTTFSNLNFSVLNITANGINGAPYGQFDFGAALGGSFEGGGSPNSGVPIGSAATFTFDFSGIGLDTLTSQSFINAFSGDSKGAGQGTQYLVVRFRGFMGGGSDKVPATGGNPPPPVSVPEPDGLLMLAFGLLAIGGLSFATQARLSKRARETVEAGT